MEIHALNSRLLSRIRFDDDDPAEDLTEEDLCELSLARNIEDLLDGLDDAATP